MEYKHFDLGSGETGRLVKIFRILFGLVCIAVAVFWLVYSIRSSVTNKTLWITIIFLLGFGFFQIWSGFGHATRFIEIYINRIRLKKNAIAAPIEIMTEEIENVEIFPLNVIFFLKTGRKIRLRFGITYHESNEKILEKILEFAELNSIPVKISEENL